MGKYNEKIKIMKDELISIIIPTKNSDKYLYRCLSSIFDQDYKKFEILIIDSGSTDKTLKIAKLFNCKIINYKPKISNSKFDAPYKRNFGVKKSSGKYIYYFDADMEMSKGLLTEINKNLYKYDALIVPEDSVGSGIWAYAKHIERRCYWGDNSIEASRVFKKNTWDTLGGLDTSLGGGGDDWDLQNRLMNSKFKFSRTKNIVFHNEGKLSLINLLKKRFMYGRDSIKYLVKKPKSSFISYFPIRKAYIINWKLFICNPIVIIPFIFMRFCEYTAGFVGIIYSRIYD